MTLSLEEKQASNVKILADTDYQGIQKIHINAIVPIKKNETKY